MLSLMESSFLRAATHGHFECPGDESFINRSEATPGGSLMEAQVIVVIRMQ